MTHMKTIHTLIVGVALALAAAPAVACSAAGPETHVGKLLGIDPAAQNFTILDAETNQPVSFEANQSQMQQLQGRKGYLKVKYQRDGDKLKAKTVK